MDGSGQNNPDRNEGPWGKSGSPLERRCSNESRPSTQHEERDASSEEHEGGRQTARREDLVVDGKAPSEHPALKPWRRKSALRNFRGSGGDASIMRSPDRATALPGVGTCARFGRDSTDGWRT